MRSWPKPPDGGSEEKRVLATVVWILGYFAPVIGPGIAYFLTKNQPFVRYHALMCVWHQIVLAAVLLALVLSPLGEILRVGLGFYALVVTIMGGLAAYRGEFYEVPIYGNAIAKRIR